MVGYVKVRTIFANGRIDINHLTWSLLTERLEGLSEAEVDGFWNKVSTKLPNGDDIKLIVSEGL